MAWWKRNDVSSPDPQQRITALRRLVDTNSGRALATARSLVARDPDKSVRQAAVTAIAGMLGSSAQHELKEFLRDGDLLPVAAVELARTGCFDGKWALIDAIRKARQLSTYQPLQRALDQIQPDWFVREPTILMNAIFGSQDGKADIEVQRIAQEQLLRAFERLGDYDPNWPNLPEWKQILKAVRRHPNEELSESSKRHLRSVDPNFWTTRAGMRTIMEYARTDDLNKLRSVGPPAIEYLVMCLTTTIGLDHESISEQRTALLVLKKLGWSARTDAERLWQAICERDPARIGALGHDGITLLLKVISDYPLHDGYQIGSGTYASPGVSMSTLLNGLSRSGDERAFEVLSRLVMDHGCPALGGKYFREAGAALADTRTPEAAAILLAAMHVPECSGKEYDVRRRYLVEFLGNNADPSSLGPLSDIVLTSQSLSKPAIEAISKILDRSLDRCSGGQLRSVLSLPDRVSYLESVTTFDKAVHEWPEVAQVAVDLDCKGMKALAATELGRRNMH